MIVIFLSRNSGLSQFKMIHYRNPPVTKTCKKSNASTKWVNFCCHLSLSEHCTRFNNFQRQTREFASCRWRAKVHSRFTTLWSVELKRSAMYRTETRGWLWLLFFLNCHLDPHQKNNTTFGCQFFNIQAMFWYDEIKCNNIYTYIYIYILCNVYNID